MINFKYPSTLAFFFGALLFFSACKKDSDPTYEPPVTEPLTVAAAKPGDTIIIKGQNFSDVASDNVVTFNGVKATVVSATATEIVVVVPANAASGKVEITVHGHTVEIGSIALMPLTLFAIKETDAQPFRRELVGISPKDGKESIIYNLHDITDDNLYDLTYLAATNELVGINGEGSKLVKVNLTTKQATSLTIATNKDMTIAPLMNDGKGNLYSVKYDWSLPKPTMTLIKIDPKTGAVATVVEWEYTNSWYNIEYLPASNEIVGIYQAQNLFKFNLTTKATSYVTLPGSPSSSELHFGNLVVANSELYGVKNEHTPSTGYVQKFVKINSTTGEVTEISDLTQSYMWDGFTFIPETKEIATIYKEKEIYRYNVLTKTSSSLSLSTSSDVYYTGLTSN